MRAMQPIRWGVIKKFFNKFKYNKEKRDLVLSLVEESEESIKEVMLDEYVHFLDAIPEIR